MLTTQPLLQVERLVKHFPVSGGVVKAVDEVSLTLHPGATFGLVGESGCGKTTVGRTILRLIEPSSGRIIFQGRDLLALKPAALRQVRRDMQIVFQDPYASLNPRLRIGDAIAEPLIIHNIGTPRSRRERVAELLRIVGLDPDYATRYPHEFSGGQRQRVGIARALALEPPFIVADEPVSALDVSVQAQIINLLADLREQFRLTYLFISHGLAVVEHFCTEIGVMYLGKLVEVAPTSQLFTQPRHPYTQALLESIPVPDPTCRKGHAPLAGDLPSPLSPPSGCGFHPRCPIAVAECRHCAPPLRDSGDGHQVACWLAR